MHPDERTLPTVPAPPPDPSATLGGAGPPRNSELAEGEGTVLHEELLAGGGRLAGPAEPTEYLEQPPPSALDSTTDLPLLGPPSSVREGSAPPGSSVIELPGGERSPSLPGFRPIKLLGEGSYGKVWLYQEYNSGRRVAVKFFSRGTSEQWLLLQAEVQQLSRLDGDPGIVQIKKVEIDSYPPYFVMTYAEQGSLAERLAQGPLPAAEALRIFEQVVHALAYVHTKGIRHCDLKPGNILLDARGRALVADFGQAHLGGDVAAALGTFFYMAPEQADLGTTVADPRWDVYSLGALFHVMVTGQPPREAPEIRAALAATSELDKRLQLYRDWVRSAPRPRHFRRVRGVDGDLARIIDGCLETDPDRRPRDAGAVLAALERRRHTRRQRPVLLFGLLAPVFLLLIMAGCALWGVMVWMRDFDQILIRQQQNSDLAMAHLVANVVEDELAARKQFIEACAANPELRAALQRQDKNALKDLLRQLFDRGDHKGMDSLLVVNADGALLADYPEGPQPITRFHWRDWFHGQGDHDPNEPLPPVLGPIRQTHVSHPYLSERNQREMTIGISTPLFTPGPIRQLLGVLVGRVVGQQLHGWLDKVEMPGDGIVVLVDDRGFVLLHKGPEADKPVDAEQVPIRRHAECELFQRAIQDRQGRGEYRDPISGEDSLAGYARIGGDQESGGCWAAVVQHARAGVLQPVGDLKTGLWTIGHMMTLAAVLVTCALWAWLIRTLRQEDVPAG